MGKNTSTLLLTCAGLLFYLHPHASTVFRNQGLVRTTGTGNEQTTLHIGGDMKFANGTDARLIPSMTIESSRVKLTGDLFNDVNKGIAGGNLFSLPASGNNGVLEFCGHAAQQVTTSGTTNSNIPSKRDNFINLPAIDINNSNHVTLDSRLAARAQDITLSKGWLVLDSELARVNVDGGVEVNPEQESVLAHLLVEGDIDYKESLWAGKPANERGFIQVNLKIPGEGTASAKSIVGFGIPFGEMRNDYFMFNTLLAPSPAGFLADPPLIDPTTVMSAGKGYVVGIDLRGTDAGEYGALEDYEGIIDFSQRATDGYRFNRHAFAGYAPSNQLFGTTPTGDAYTKEKLNTQDITLPVQAGYNYLANPYTCPLNIDKLLGNDAAQGTWGIQADAVAQHPQMRNQVWILGTDSKAEPTDQGRISRYTYNYQVAMKTGGTYIDNDNTPGVTAIAPLQLFVIRTYSTASTITIPKGERVMGTSRFLRSLPEDETRRDDFIIEFRDRTTGTSDRASIVLREEGEIGSNANYANVERLVSTSSEGADGTRSAQAAAGDFEQSLASQIYTRDAGGTPLTVQFLPLETTRVTLYHVPSSQAQPLNILGLRLDTKDKVTRLWLEDSKYDTRVEITPETLYETYSEPTDPHDRFAIRFSTQATPIEGTDDGQQNIYAYSQQRDIYVQGFAPTAYGDIAELYDAQGCLLARKAVGGEKLLLMENCAAGVYIVRVNAKTPKTVKLIVR